MMVAGTNTRGLRPVATAIKKVGLEKTFLDRAMLLGKVQPAKENESYFTLMDRFS